MQILRRVFVCLLLGLLALALWRTPALAQSDAGIATQAQVLALLAETREWMQAPTPAQAVALAQRWEALRVLAPISPQQAPRAVNFTQLASALRADAPNFEFIRLQLDSISTILQSSLEFPADDLQKILARAEFDYSQKPPTLWERFWGWVSRALVRVLSPAVKAIYNYRELSEIFLWGTGIFALLASLWFVLRQLARNRIVLDALSPEEAIERGLLNGAQATTRARALANAGDTRSAVRYWYLSALLFLQERGLLRFDRSLTNREYLRLVQSDPRLHQHLAAVVTVFDRVWYGYEALQPEELAAFQAEVYQLAPNLLSETSAEKK